MNTKIIIKAYLDDQELGHMEIDPAGDYVPNFNQNAIQRVVLMCDERWGARNWTSFEYIKHKETQ